MCFMELLNYLSSHFVLPRKGRLLDIGEACLVEADPQDIAYFLSRHGGRTEGEEIRQKIEYLAYRSRLYGHHEIPTLFMSEVLELTDIEYVSFDVVSARVARRFDLNRHKLARSKRNTFDVAVNFGTTEHIMNQYNAFEVIHDAVKPGGYMFHQIPSTGYINHGYFNYNALMFKELAEANDYEICDLWFNGTNGYCEIIADNLKYAASVADPSRMKNDVEGFKKSPVINSNICILLRKTKDAEFRVGLEVKTAAADLNEDDPFDQEYIEPSAPTSTSDLAAYQEFAMPTAPVPPSLWMKLRALLKAG